MPLIIPPRLAAACAGVADRADWLARLPEVVGQLETLWSLTLSEPFTGDDVSCAWVAPAITARGTRVVLKVGMPHFEGRDEADGLRFWNGDPTIELLAADRASGAMLLEHCDPGTSLRALPEAEQDRVIAGLLRRLWRPPAGPHSFRPLSQQIDLWSEETRACESRWSDAGLVREGLRLFDQLSRDNATGVVLATDLHAGNVLRAARAPWLVIDPKPFVGDSAYDATQHLLNGLPRLQASPFDTIERFADLLQIDSRRVRLWLFARLAAEPRDDWSGASALGLARAVAP